MSSPLEATFALTTERVLSLLASRHDPQKWLYVQELRCGTGYDDWGERYRNGAKWERRMDAFAMALWPSAKFERRAYEVKVSRGDFLHEIANEDKRAMGMALSNRFYFVVPEGIIDRSEVPDDCGLIVMGIPKGKKCLSSRVSVPAPWRDVDDPPLRFWASFGRRIRNDAEQSAHELVKGER